MLPTTNTPFTVAATGAVGDYSFSVQAVGSDSKTTTHQVSVVLHITTSAAPDFTLTSSTASQTVASGQTSGAYNLTVAPNPPGSTFDSAVTLLCPSGLPFGAQCLFNLNPVTPGANPAPVAMTISTSPNTATLQRPGGNTLMFAAALWLALPGILFAWGKASASPQRPRKWLLSIASLALLALPSCGGVSAGGSGGGGRSGHGTPPGTYQITVTAGSGTISHNITPPLTLIVQ